MSHINNNDTIYILRAALILDGHVISVSTWLRISNNPMLSVSCMAESAHCQTTTSTTDSII